MIHSQEEKVEAELQQRTDEYVRFATAELRENQEKERQRSRQEIEDNRNVNSVEPIPKNPRLQKTECNNPSCTEVYYKGDTNHSAWEYCSPASNRKCKLIFCPAEACISSLALHRAVCKKK